VTGRSDPLVLLPGMNCSAQLWTSVLGSPGLGPGGPEVWHPHLEGRSLDDCVDRLLAQLPARFALVGHSLGAIVALALTRRAPERVSRLALLAVNPLPPRPDQQEAWSAQRRSLAEGTTARALQEQLLPVLVPAHRRAELDAVVLEMADEVGARRLDDQLAIQQTRVDERGSLHLIRVPTLVVAGEQDALVPVARHEEVAAEVADHRLVVLPGTGHLAPLEEPAAVAAALASWLDRSATSDP
jgi:pimeloyl-ACP methyl ester carboxylesterase